MRRVHVALGDRSHDVLVAAGVRHEVGRVVTDVGARRCLVVTQEPVAEHWLADVSAALDRAGVDTAVHVMPDGEVHKTVASLEEVWAACARVPLSRDDVIVALGGGVVTDLAGFAAATYNRGIAVVHVPTTVLGQVDAAIGGKTGIDLPAGKNLVGAIHQPRAVLADPATLATLPLRVRREGFGEVVKHALLADEAMLVQLEASGPSLLDHDADLTDLIARNVAIKAAVVGDDEREMGRRAHLNLGHTYGHVLELLVGWGQWWHGEAVSVGLLVALALGEQLGLHDQQLRLRTTDVLASLGLPTASPVLDDAEVLTLMARDKKTRGALRWVVLDEVAAPRVVTPTVEQVLAAVHQIQAPDVQWPPAKES